MQSFIGEIPIDQRSSQHQRGFSRRLLDCRVGPRRHCDEANAQMRLRPSRRRIASAATRRIAGCAWPTTRRTLAFAAATALASSTATFSD